MLTLKTLVVRRRVSIMNHADYGETVERKRGVHPQSKLDDKISCLSYKI